MAPLIDTNSSDSEGDDMSDTIEPSCPTMATTPPSPQTPKTKSKSSKRSIDITPTACSMSRLNAETVEHANLEVRSVGKDTGAGDSPSPTKKRRISRLSVQEKDSGPFTSLFCRNSLFKVDENEEVLPFDEGSEKTCERVEHDLSQEKERMVEVEKLFLDHIAFCGGNKQKKMAPKIGRSGSDTAYAASLNNLVDGEVYAKEETHGKFKLAIRTENLEKGIRSVQAREERAEMDVTPLESLDVDMPGSSEFALGNKNLSKTVQSVRGRKGRTEMALKTLELLNGMAETDSSKGWGEMRSLADGFERVIVRLELEENLQMALEKKEGAEIYPKEMETLNDEVGTRKRKTLPRTKILKSFIIGRLEEDLQMLKETLETSFERLECLNDETETSFNKAKEAQLRMDITSDAALLLENDREVRIPPANEDEVVTMEDIRDKIPEASTSAAELLTNQDSTISQAGSLPGSTNQGSTHMRGGSLSRNTAEIPTPQDFNDEDAMFQQALIRSNYDEFLKSKICACSFPCSHRNHINKDTKPATVEDDEEISSIFLDISGAEEEDDDEISDSCSSEFDYTAVYVNGEGKGGLDKKKRAEKREKIRDADEAAILVNRVKEGLLAATAEQLKNAFIQMFPQECSVLTEDEGANGVNEKSIEDTAKIIKRAFIHFNVDVFNKALTEASEKALAEAEAQAGASSPIASSNLKDLVGQNIFMKWEMAYAQINLMRPDELMRAIGVLISFTRSTPYASAILKDTPESEYDALVVYIHYYLQMCVQVKCMDITKGGRCPEDAKWRTDMPCFVPWWKQVSHETKDEFKREWNKGVLSKEVLYSVEADGGAGAVRMVDKFPSLCSCASYRCY